MCNELGVTLMLTGEGRVQTSKCRQAGCSVHSVEYEIPVSQIEALILMSEECEQYVRYVRDNLPKYKVIQMTYQMLLVRRQLAKADNAIKEITQSSAL